MRLSLSSERVAVRPTTPRRRSAVSHGTGVMQLSGGKGNGSC